jgi:Fe-S-cluster containining protein
MSSHHDQPRTLTATMELAIGTQKLKLNLVVPTDEVAPESMVPALRQLTNTIIDGVEDNARNQGFEVSCKKGCGACCRQHVPISRAEARLLAELVEELPEPRRSKIKARFASAMERLRASGLFEASLNFHLIDPRDRVALVGRYFKLGIACPFLEEESCSIYADRPLICREYLVISSPKHCATLNGDEIERLKVPVSVSSTFSKMEGAYEEGENPFLPLILALEWVEEHGRECETRPGPSWVQQFFQDLSGSKIPDPDGPDTMLS